MGFNRKGFQLVGQDVAPDIGLAPTLGQVDKSAGLGANPGNVTEALKVSLGNPTKPTQQPNTNTSPPQDRIGRYGPGGITQ